MAAAEMTTTKIDRETLNKLKKLAARSRRSQVNELAVLVDRAYTANPADISDQELFTEMLDAIIENSENGIASDESIKNAKAFSEAGRISWGGEEDGRIIGVLANGTRCDVDGNVIQNNRH